MYVDSEEEEEEEKRFVKAARRLNKQRHDKKELKSKDGKRRKITE